MPRNLSYLITLLLIGLMSTGSISAQTECDSDQYQKGLRKNQSFNAPCDSMVVLNKPTFNRWIFEKEKAKAEMELLQKRHDLLMELNKTKDSVIMVHQMDIKSLEVHKATTDSLVGELKTNLEQCIKNTDEAIAIAHRKKIQGLVIGGITGGVLGILAGIILF